MDPTAIQRQTLITVTTTAKRTRTLTILGDLLMGLHQLMPTAIPWEDPSSQRILNRNSNNSSLRNNPPEALAKSA